ITAIGAAILRAMEAEQPIFFASCLGSKGEVAMPALDGAIRKSIVKKLDGLLKSSREYVFDKDQYKEWAKSLIEILGNLSNSLAVKLFLFIDQAEEVL